MRNSDESNATLDYLINHLFLPPLLPQKNDHSADNDLNLARFIASAIKQYQQTTTSNGRAWIPVTRMMDNVLFALHTPTLVKENVQSLMGNMQNQDVVVLPIRAQNACVIIRQFDGGSTLDKQTVFECFEVDPPNAVVMGATGRVVRTFPGLSLSIPTSSLPDTLQAEIASFLAQMDADILDDAVAHSKKAGSKVDEYRDTTDPHYITNLFTAILRGLPGTRQVKDGSIIKHTRNDILWDKAYLPWRRSPLWLIIRVAIQTTLLRAGLPHEFKHFMLFLLSQILFTCTSRDHASSDLLFCMQRKIAHRLSKLTAQVNVPEALLSEIRVTLEHSKGLLDRRWRIIQRGQPRGSEWKPSTFNLTADCNLSLRSSKPYILKRLSIKSRRKSFASSALKKEPTRLFRSPNKISNFRPSELARALQEDPTITLMDIEAFVINELALLPPQKLTISIDELHECLTTYLKAAKPAYKGNPEACSVMLLTIFLMWMALDKLALHHVPLLAKYSPEVPLHLLEPLLLNKQLHLNRFLHFNAYLRDRHNRAVHGSIFDDKVTSNSFSVLYFNASADLNNIKTQVEANATALKAAKLRELAQATSAYESRLSAAEQLDHQCSTGWTKKQKKRCAKCQEINLAKKVKIKVYEWPLPPPDSLEAKAVVFEMRPPFHFQVWRSATYKLLYSQCRVGLLNSGSSSPFVVLSQYDPLKEHVTVRNASHVTYASKTKTMMQSHYSALKVWRATEANICVANALNYHLYDPATSRWIDSHPFADCTISPYCHFQLSDTSTFHPLSYALMNTSHPPNRPIAEAVHQTEHTDTNQHIAFATLRSGSNLQWLNIARELRTRTLTFSEPDIQALILQAAFQVGPISSTGLEWHSPLQATEFGLRLIEEINQYMSEISDNWSHANGLLTAVLLVGRILASNNDSDLVSTCIRSMETAREIAFSWVERLTNRVTADIEAVNGEQYQLAIVLVACLATYDVDTHHHIRIMKSRNALRIYLQSLILLHDNPPLDQTDGSHHVVRIRRLACILYPYIETTLRNSPEDLDHAIRAIWTAYQPSHSWTVSGSRWWSTTTTPMVDSEQVNLQLDVRTGSLLIDGKPLGTLPRTISEHPTFIRLFGRVKMTVTPSFLPEMEFASSREIAAFGHQRFHFALSGTQLIIQATRGNYLSELVPHEVLLSDFPLSLAQDFHHWLSIPPSRSLKAAVIEFQPLSSPWESTHDGWLLVFKGNHATISTKDQDHPVTLVDIHSPTFQAISGQLKTLEEPSHIHAVVENPQVLQIHLPRYRLSFHLKDGHLESTNFRGMIVDPDQSCGTLIGLQHRLVLTSTTSPGRDSILIPFGSIEHFSTGNHVSVNIQLDKESRKVTYFKYDLDNELQALVGPNSLVGELYCIYLHALTSHIVPDPFLGRTGLEEAFRRLASARCKSFQGLGTKEKALFNQIANLIPKRSWYPTHLQTMQTVKWKSLSPLSHHWNVHLLVKDILDYETQLSLFRSDADAESEQDDTPIPNHHLHVRSASRMHYLYSTDYEQHSQPATPDAAYPAFGVTYPHRSNTPGSHDVQLVSDMTRLVQAWTTRLDVKLDLWDFLYQLKQIENIVPSFTLSYSKQYLEPDLSALFLPMYALSQTGKRNPKRMQAQFTITLPAMAYVGISRQILSTLLAFATSPQFNSILPPDGKSYKLTDERYPSPTIITQLVLKHALPMEQCHQPVGVIQLPGEQHQKYIQRLRNAYLEACQSRAMSHTDKVLDKWPDISAIPSLNDGFFKRNPPEYQQAIRNLFSSCLRNEQLHTFVTQLQACLHALEPDQSSSQFTLPLRAELPPTSSANSCSFGPENLSQLVQQRKEPSQLPEPPRFPNFNPPGTSFPSLVTTTQRRSRLQDPRLMSLIEEIICCDSPLLWKYGHSLASSQDSLRRDYHMSLRSVEPEHLFQELSDYLEQCHQHFWAVLDIIVESLSPKDTIGAIMILANYWPRVTPSDLLLLLSQGSALQSAPAPNVKWINVIRTLAASLMRLQQAQRLLNHAQVDALNDLETEFGNEITDTRLHAEPADWLLIQIQGNFFGRSLQKSVAKEMISPRDCENTLLQLNMGEGKTSVIVPLIASTLANGKNLVRIIVLKPLAKSMFHLLVQRLTGLANRRIFYLPVSRDLQLTDAKAQQLFHLFRMCACEGGLLIAQPEHILSFKLMGIDMAKSELDSTSTSLSHTLLNTQSWLAAHSRDVLDESDEILNVQYQLVYTTGRQMLFENHPDRWLIIQDALCWAKEEALDLRAGDPTGLQIETSPRTSFPVIRILQGSSGQQLVNNVARRCMESPRLRLLPPDLRHQALAFISGQQLAKGDLLALKNAISYGTWAYLLIFRGLIGLGILQFVLEQKRWRVNFGLDLSRTLLAVPYRAKDVPAIRADFGHPDVAICLTCLSYYYSGLNKEQLELCFRILLKLDNPVTIYETWVIGHDDLPLHLRQIIGINLDDTTQMEDILFPLFHKHQFVIDFYLSRVVFPREAKQFPAKFSTSAWDLAEHKGPANVTTGFSGTNDNQPLLPTTIAQKDPLNQIGTNARVLSCLLRQENDHYRVLDGHGQLLCSADFLRQITREDPPVRVLLDVGAQMLDMQSPEIAKTWLSMEPRIEAVIFFDDEDRLVVMRRDLSVDQLETTPYAQNLDLCSIYLDDAHTRGTDLKFPKGYRAAVTLGPKLTKDRLVQGCMRMRKLGQGHSVIFLSPMEVDNAIRSFASEDLTSVSTADILRWAIRNTCEQITRYLPNWAEQGVDYHQRKEAWEHYTSNPSAPSALTNLVAAWESRDARTLEEMYCPSTYDVVRRHPAYSVPTMKTHLEELGLELEAGMRLDEEQEREVHYEVEKERQVQRPPTVQPAKHQVHGHVIHLVQSGTFVTGSPAFSSLFSSLRHLGDPGWSSNLLATRDFCTTIVGTAVESTDYLRPVHWILTIRNDPRIVVLSPFEANELLPAIQKSSKVHLHVYAPRLNESMAPMEDLRFLVIPPLHPDWEGPSSVDIAQLNLWAGQLYLKDYPAYTELLLVLGLVGEEARTSERQLWEADGFVPPQNRTGEMARVCKFKHSPVSFLKKLISLRQRGAPFDKSHIGKILEGQLLTAEDFRYHQSS